MQNNIVLAIIFIIFGFGITVTGQALKDTDKKADSNLKSSARINPSTLAMEFSVPFAGYSGRAGNSLPIAFRYSSKVWTMREMHNQRAYQGGIGSQTNPFLYTYFTSILPEFGERTRAGWTSSLQPISIVPDAELLEGGSQNSSNPDVQSCTLISSYIMEDLACPMGRAVFRYSCPIPPEQIEEGGQTNTEVEISICNGDPWGDPTTTGGGGSGQTPNLPVPTFKVKRLRLQMPDGSNTEFRKDDKFYNCYTESCRVDDGNYLSVDGSQKRLVVETLPNSAKLHTLYMPDGGALYFRWLRAKFAGIY